MANRSFSNRLAKAERLLGGPNDADDWVDVFFAQGPIDSDAAGYLTSLGYGIGKRDIVVRFVRAEDGIASPLPLEDLTPRFAPEKVPMR